MITNEIGLRVVNYEIMVFKMSDRESEIIHVQSSCLGMITGKGGSMIKELSQDMGCRIRESETIDVKSSCLGMMTVKVVL